jgi:hypothetical protein
MFDELRRFALAMRCFRAASDLCKHVIELHLPEDDFLYGACMAGIVVTYARPFSCGDDIGGLRGFSRFENTKFRSAHQELIETRKKVYAHHDASGIENLEIRNRSESDAYAVTLELEKGKYGKYFIRPDVRVPQITTDSLPAFVELFRFQMNRGEQATDVVVKKLGAGKFYSLGFYELGINFP